jgi:hypothetical protein
MGIGDFSPELSGLDFKPDSFRANSDYHDIYLELSGLGLIGIFHIS